MPEMPQTPILPSHAQVLNDLVEEQQKSLLSVLQPVSDRLTDALSYQDKALRTVTGDLKKQLTRRNKNQSDALQFVADQMNNQLQQRVDEQQIRLNHVLAATNPTGAGGHLNTGHDGHNCPFDPNVIIGWYGMPPCWHGPCPQEAPNPPFNYPPGTTELKECGSGVAWYGPKGVTGAANWFPMNLCPCPLDIRPPISPIVNGHRPPISPPPPPPPCPPCPIDECCPPANITIDVPPCPEPPPPPPPPPPCCGNEGEIDQTYDTDGDVSPLDFGNPDDVGSTDWCERVMRLKPYFVAIGKQIVHESTLNRDMIANAMTLMNTGQILTPGDVARIADDIIEVYDAMDLSVNKFNVPLAWNRQLNANGIIEDDTIYLLAFKQLMQYFASISVGSGKSGQLTSSRGTAGGIGLSLGV